MYPKRRITKRKRKDKRAKAQEILENFRKLNDKCLFQFKLDGEEEKYNSDVRLRWRDRCIQVFYDEIGDFCRTGASNLMQFKPPPPKEWKNLRVRISLIEGGD